MIPFSSFVDARTCRVQKMLLIGFQGQSMDEEKRLFDRLNEHADHITAKKNDDPYLVVSGKVPAPFVAVEVSDFLNVPEGMGAFTIPEGEYVSFTFKKEHVGDFWANVCTSENQALYNIDLSKARFERLTAELHDTGFVKWFIPTNKHKSAGNM